MSTYTYVKRNFDGIRYKKCRAYDVPKISDADYWISVTDVSCPIDGCGGIIRWHEAGYVPGYRICDTCLRHFMAAGSSKDPCLIRIGNRKG